MVRVGQVQHHKLHIPEKVRDFRGLLVFLRRDQHDLHVGAAADRLYALGSPSLLRGFLLVGVMIVHVSIVFVIFVHIFVRLSAQSA